MRQLTIRVTDPQYESLRRILTHEKAERGVRYSMSDLCARLLMLQLSRSVASVPQLDAPSPLGDGTVMPDVAMTRGLGYIHIAPPPPVPKLEPTIWPPAAAPQPERLTHAQPTRESESDTPSPLNQPKESDGPAADGADPEANESAHDASEIIDEVDYKMLVEEDDGNVGN